MAVVDLDKTSLRLVGTEHDSGRLSVPSKTGMFSPRSSR